LGGGSIAEEELVLLLLLSIGVCGGIVTEDAAKWLVDDEDDANEDKAIGEAKSDEVLTGDKVGVSLCQTSSSTKHNGQTKFKSINSFGGA
tara:strand:- start:589 stop:858 length:270 start_codon:yes stop_codon:yes gene_type:complete